MIKDCIDKNLSILLSLEIMWLKIRTKQWYDMTYMATNVPPLEVCLLIEIAWRYILSHLEQHFLWYVLHGDHLGLRNQCVIGSTPLNTFGTGWLGMKLICNLGLKIYLEGWLSCTTDQIQTSRFVERDRDIWGLWGLWLCFITTIQ